MDFENVCFHTSLNCKHFHADFAFEIKCKVCKKPFRQERGMISHMRKFHGSKDWTVVDIGPNKKLFKKSWNFTPNTCPSEREM